MHIIQLQMLPVELDIGDRIVKIPKMPFSAAIEWSAEISGQIIDKITEGMEEHQRREYLTFYPPMNADLRTLKMAIATPGGIDHVLRLQLPLSKVYGRNGAALEGAAATLTEVEVDQILQAGTGPLSALAREVADLEERQAVRVPAPKPGSGDADPLKNTGKQG